MTMAEVIIVASDAAFKRSLVFVLESGGFRVLQYTTLEASLASPQIHDVGCAVVDEEAIRGYAQNLSIAFGCPVILLVDQPRPSPNAGAVKYLTKPYLGEPLLQAVHEAVTGNPGPDT
jgi:FixJ family two-component response regulator